MRTWHTTCIPKYEDRIVRDKFEAETGEEAEKLFFAKYPQYKGYYEYFSVKKTYDRSVKDSPELTQQARDTESLKRIKAYVYGFGKPLNSTDTRWLIEMAEKAIKSGL